MKKIILIIVICIGTIIFLLGFVDRDYNKELQSTADITYSIDVLSNDFKSIGDLTKRQQDIICATSRGLIEIDAEGNVIPSLAESVHIKDEGIEYEFKFRDDVFWSDGSKVMPEDFLFFLREVISEESSNKAILNIFGVSEFLSTNKSFKQTVGISVTDESLIIRLNSPDSNFLNELSKPQYRLRKNILLWEDIDKNYSKLIYSGNYYINSIEEEQVVLERSIKSNISLPKTIHLVKEEEEDLALASFEIGKRDIVINPPKSQLERLKNTGEIITMPSNRAVYLAFDNNSKTISFDNKQKIYRLINKATIEYASLSNFLVDYAEYSYFRGSSGELSQLQSRNVMVNTDYDEEIKSIEKINIIAEETVANKEYLDYLHIWFKENTDITLNVNLLNENDINNENNTLYYDVKLVNIEASLENDSDFIEVITQYIDDKNKEKLTISKSAEEREIVFSQIEDSLFNEYNIMPLMFYNDNIAVNTKVKNITLDANGNIDFNNIEK